MGYILCFIIGAISGMIAVCCIVVNKINEYEKIAISEINENKKLMSELHELKYGKNYNITYLGGKFG